MNMSARAPADIPSKISSEIHLRVPAKIHARVIQGSSPGGPLAISTGFSSEVSPGVIQEFIKKFFHEFPR